MERQFTGWTKRTLRCLSALALFAWCFSACTGSDGLPDHPSDKLHFPIGITSAPAGNHLYVVNSNFDLAYNTGAVVTIDATTHRMVTQSSVGVPSFGGRIRGVVEDGNVTRLYLPARELNSMVWMTVQHDSETGIPNIKCDDKVTDLSQQHQCSGRYLIGGPDAQWWPGDDPFGVAVQPPVGDRPGHIVTGSFDGSMAVFEMADDGEPLFAEKLSVIPGVYDLAMHPETSRVYATSKLSNVVMNFNFSDAKFDVNNAAQFAQAAVDVELGEHLIVVNPTRGNDFGRGMSFSSDGTLAFVAYRTPASLLVIDTSIDSSGAPRNQLLTSVPMNDGPAGVIVAPSRHDGTDLVYVSNYDANQVTVFDPTLMRVVDVIDVGDGPFDLAVINNGTLFRLYVTLFEGAAISVIELDPKSPFHHQEIARIP